MSGIPHLQEAKDLRLEGDRLGRAGMSQRALELVAKFSGGNQSYKGVMELVGEMKALAIAAKCDDYWTEQVNRGYRRELYAIKNFAPESEINK